MSCVRDAIRDQAAISLIACLTLALICLVGSPARAVSPGTNISNTAMATYNTASLSASNTTTTVVVAANSAASIEFLRFDPSGGSPENVDAGQLCSASGTSAGPFVAMPNPTDLSGAPIDLAAPVDLRSTSTFLAQEAVFLRVIDADQNLDGSLVDSVVVSYSIGATGDTEAATLFETGVDTGVFTGSIMLANPPPGSGDCQLAAAANSALVARYTDPLDPLDSVQATATVAPSSVAFDAATGALLDGVGVSLVDDATGLPAAVFGADGVSSYPSTVVTGAGATDSGGQTYTFTPGQYVFPFLMPGTYRLVVAPPAGYTAPSAVPTTFIQTLPGAPFSVVPGSRGGAFTVTSSPAIQIDIPLDADTSGLFATKAASKREVEIGEFVQYRVEISSGAGSPLASNAELVDLLPPGLRYEAGSARLDAVIPIAPVISNGGRELRFPLGTIAAGQSHVVKYVVTVSLTAPPGTAVNRATLVADNGLASNEAVASVQVLEDVIAERVLVAGRVTVDECQGLADDLETGLPSVRIHTEDGTFVTTDERGLFHIEGLRPGVHLLQLDTDTLPDGYEAISCEDESSFARNPNSRFVDAQPGTLWRTDFHLRRKRGHLAQSLELARDSGSLVHRVHIDTGEIEVEGISAVVVLPSEADYLEGSATLDGVPVEARLLEGIVSLKIPEPEANHHYVLELRAAVDADRVAGDAPLSAKVALAARGPSGESLQTAPAEAHFVWSDETAGQIVASELSRVEVVAPMVDLADRLAPELEKEVRPEDRFDKYWIESQTPRRGFQYPEDGFIPGVASLKLGILNLPGDQIELTRNGERVSGLNRDGSLQNEAKTLRLSRWRGVDLVDGANRFVAVIRDEAGSEIERLERVIYFTGAPVSAELVEQESILVADGRQSPVVAVRMKDKAGRLVREGVTGTFSVNDPYQSRMEVEQQRRTILTRLEENAPTYTVGKNGIARIELHPTSVVGHVSLKFRFDADHEEEVQTWLSPGDREWVLVALATGTMGWNEDTGNDTQRSDAGLDDELFTEGRIAFFAKGKVTGDWLLTVAYDSEKEKEEVGRRLKQVIDPDEYFTLYGDRTQQGYEASSSENLYVKIERKKFYALYGDYETGLNETKLSTYNRTLTGAKSEYYGKTFRAHGFVSETNQHHTRDEIQGDGTSGLYRLSRTRIVFGSDRIRIETRDRLRSEVILESDELVSGIDYNIDYVAGTVFFRLPIPSRDSHFNPMYIVAEYEVESSSFEDVNAGGRASAHLQDDRIEIGASMIHEKAGTDRGDLVGIDGRYEVTEDTRVRAEVALSDRELQGASDLGMAYLVEVEHQSEKTRGRAYVREHEADFGLGQQNASEAGTRKYGLELSHEIDDRWRVEGDFFRHENLTADSSRNSLEVLGKYDRAPYGAELGVRQLIEDRGELTQLLYSGSRTWMNGRIGVHTAGEVGLLGGDEYGDFGDRLLVGGDFKATETATLFAEHEFLWSDGNDSMDTRAGFRMTPWQGARMSSAYHHELTENGPRGYANLGLTQSFSVGERWSFSASVDRSQTVLENGAVAFDDAVPPTTGNRNEDFTASSIGAAYNSDLVNLTARLENRYGEAEKKWGLFLSALKEHGESTSYAGNLEFFHTDGSGGDEAIEGLLRLSLAHRPDDTPIILLDRLDLRYRKEDSASFDTESHKIINHFKANHFLGRKAQVAWSFSSKYVVDTIDGRTYDSFGSLFGVELRHTFARHWDLSVHGRSRVMFDPRSHDASYGVSVGHAVVQNVWVSLGYNFAGFFDEDFSASGYTAQGPYVRFRANLDQNSVRKALDFFRK